MKRTTNKVSGHMISIHLMANICCSLEAESSYLFPLNIFRSSKKKSRSSCRSSASIFRFVVQMYQEASPQMFDPVSFDN